MHEYSKHNVVVADSMDWISFSCILSSSLCVADTGIPSSLLSSSGYLQNTMTCLHMSSHWDTISIYVPVTKIATYPDLKCMFELKDITWTGYYSWTITVMWHNFQLGFLCISTSIMACDISRTFLHYCGVSNQGYSKVFTTG